MTMRTLLLGSLLLALGLSLAPRDSHAQNGADVVLSFSKKHSGHLLKALDDGYVSAAEAEPVAYFKVPARKAAQILCKLGRTGQFECTAEEELVCPGFVNLELPNGAVLQVELDCERPNEATEECECEISDEN